jgi:hypothetical protein
MGTQRTAFVHVGTHKTGTSSLQSMLARNERTLHGLGVFVPSSGRTDQASAGHHNIAWELGANPQFDPRAGTFADLIDEVAACDVPTVCVSSEEFEFLFEDRAALLTLRDGFAAIGYETRIILYLRPQADYLESLYAEIVKAWDVGFDGFLETIVATGGYRFIWATYDQNFRALGSCLPTLTGMCSQFSYDVLAGAFGDVFGDANVIVRAYRSSCSSAMLLRAFLDILAPGRISLKQLRRPERMNRSLGFGEVIAARAARLRCERRHRIPARQRFDPLGLLDLVRIGVCFSRSNERLAARFGVYIAAATRATLLRELLTAVLHDRDSLHRKQLLRALNSDEVWAIPAEQTSAQNGTALVQSAT